MLSDDAVRARKVRIRGIEQDTGFPDVYITPRSKCRLVGRIYVEPVVRRIEKEACCFYCQGVRAEHPCNSETVRPEEQMREL